MKMHERDILQKLLNASSGGWITTKELDKILLECNENANDAHLHCNSMMRRGLIDYHSDGDWEILVTQADLDEEKNDQASNGNDGE